jgi:hypothetical protein
MKDIIVELRGGVVVEIYCDEPDVRVTIVDWDEVRSENSQPTGVLNWDHVPISSLPIDTRLKCQRIIKGIGEADDSFITLAKKRRE